MQTISGVHYNFFLPMAFWQAKCGDIWALMPKRKFLRAISALSAITIVSVGSFLICLVHLRRFVLLSCKENQRRCRLRNRVRYVLPAVCDLSSFERSRLYQ
ncbi:hypothetical protein ACVXHA_27880 [Escherichia coli]